MIRDTTKSTPPYPWLNPDDQQMVFCDPCRTLTIIPAYNESRFIGSVVLQARQFSETVVVVDDGSTDDTARIAEAAGAIVLRHPHNQGKGAALNTGFCYAREMDPDAVITLDADGQHLPQQILAVVAPVLDDKADVVVGSRYLEHTSDVPKHRIVGHQVFNRITEQLSGTHLTDSQSGFRAFSRKALESVSFQSNGFSVESEMQFWVRDQDLRLVEVPITIRYTDKPKRPVIKHGMMVLTGILRLVGQYRPLLFLGVPGTIMLVAGLFWGLRVVDIYRTSQILATGYALISVLLAILGSLALFTGIILHSVRGLLVEVLRSMRVI